MYKTCERLFLRRFFFSLFLFPQRKNSFLKSSWQKTGCTSRIISREVLVAPTSVLLWSFSSMLSKNHILSKPVMNVVHQMRMKIKFIILWEVAGCFPHNHSRLDGHHFLQQKNWFSGFSMSSTTYKWVKNE